MKHYEVEIRDAKTREKLCFLDKVEPQATISEIKTLFTKTQGKSLKDEDVLQKLPVGTTATLYFRDLGAQISWVTVSSDSFPGLCLHQPPGPLTCLWVLPGLPDGVCWAPFHLPALLLPGALHLWPQIRLYIQSAYCGAPRLHVPLLPLHQAPAGDSLRAPILSRNHAPAKHLQSEHLILVLPSHQQQCPPCPRLTHLLFQNCTYYWGFAAWMAYYINHPLYTPPTYGVQQVKLALAIFVICQLGNFSIHMALRDLRPAGSKTRKIPYPTKNPFTWLFLLVSCPNYTYEVGSWIGFAIMTQCVPVALFSLVGFTQMTIWAKGKHRSYLKEFRDYPPLRMPIIPFLL
uniref:Trans-2,3-enoyl-CoA reductase like 2 n=1 Tax=Rattus norvegicus TaxID=10116 RepID=A0A8I5ZWG2_RAT